jgi:hypothetical protein
MREIRTSGLMSGEGKRGYSATAPLLDSTRYLQNYSVISTFSRFGCFSGDKVSALDLAVS